MNCFVSIVTSMLLILDCVGCTLTRDRPIVTWGRDDNDSLQSEDDEEHQLCIKQVASATINSSPIRQRALRGTFHSIVM